MVSSQLKTGNSQLKKAQSTLELTMVLIVVFVLLIGITKIFVWVNERMVFRQEAYENDPKYGRIAAGSASGEVPLLESAQPYPELDIFGTGQ